MQRQTVRLHDLSGKDVVARAQSAKVGTVADVLFSPSDGSIGYVFIEAGGGGFGGLGGRREAVPGSNLHAVGPDALVIEDSSSIIDDVERIDRTGYISAGEVKGRNVITDDGERLGTINDFVLDPSQGRVVGYVVGAGRGGGFGLGGEPRREGERIISVQRNVTVGPDFITVPAQDLREGRLDVSSGGQAGGRGTGGPSTGLGGQGPGEPGIR